MIPILYEKDETAFISNGLGRLRDCISCEVTEERNGVYECDFQYPMDGANFDLIQVGRIIGVTHDESGDIEPFDIVSYTRPIEGVVTFHCVHISYRLSYCTVTASSINSLADAFTAFASAEPNMPFSFDTDKTSTGFVAAFDGIPKTVRSIMGGIEGSILDAYGGEYSFNNWSVYLHSARGQFRNFAIRYGVNMLNYEEDYDSQGTYSSVMPYWTDGTNTVLGDRVDSGGATITNRGECVPLDVSDKFDSNQGQPTKAQVEAEALAYMSEHNTFYPSQNIKVDFVRLQDMGYENLGSLMQCNLCDTIKVIFPDYNSSGTYKIVKTVWNVLEDRYEEMELGQLSVTLSEALGITNGLGGGGGSEPEPVERNWFYANSITATTIGSTNTYVKVPITSIYDGVGFEYDSVNKGIKCTKAGKYLISAQILLETATSGDLVGIAIYLNGAVSVGPAYTRTGGNYDGPVLAPSIIELNAGDYLTFYIRNNTASRGKTQGSFRLSAWEL